jgi:hypothetical protein
VKLGDANIKKAKVAKNGIGNNKKKKKLGVAVAPFTTNPKCKMPKSTKKKSAMKKKLASPANKNNASNATSKKIKKKPTTCKSDGKGQGKSTAACK